MPIKSCTKNGKSGYKWGDNGACYTGKDGKKKALKQGVAIEKSKQREGRPSEFDKASIELAELEEKESRVGLFASIANWFSSFKK